ncbi:hypothetical protein ACFYLX_07785 [Pseudarthrobacter enclensis]|uniref:hypothetical protein n=1 Tax=Pseudarthrobacter enclensis TaxID=993070 RepID=UPI0036B5B1CA
MTDIASGPRVPQLDLSGHGSRDMLPLADPLLQGYSSLAGAGTQVPLAQPAPALHMEPDDSGDDLLSAVWRTSSYVESVQWELDSANGQLVQAVRQAAAAGVAQDVLCRAANLAPEELAAALEDNHPGGPVF